MKTNFGKDTLGDGNKLPEVFKSFQTSKFNKSYTWKSTAAAGTLIPFMNEVLLPGDKAKIDLDAHVLSLPTIGPAFTSYKVQLDVFRIPLRHYIPKLMVNLEKIGNDMTEAKLPQFRVEHEYSPNDLLDDNSQFNPSSIFKYLGISGLGRNTNANTDLTIRREFNAAPWMAYWDIVKNYYANHQEGRCFVIHNDQQDVKIKALEQIVVHAGGNTDIYNNSLNFTPSAGTSYELKYFNNDSVGEIDPNLVIVQVNSTPTYISSLFDSYVYQRVGFDTYLKFYDYVGPTTPTTWEATTALWNSTIQLNEVPNLIEVQLDNIDNVKLDMIADILNPNAFIIDNSTAAPFGLALSGNEQKEYSRQSKQEGLAVKTYQSDLFNNWMNTSWIDEVNLQSSVDTSSGSFKIDTLNLAKKIYELGNRIAMTGGTYDDWQEATYDVKRTSESTIPIYEGSLVKEFTFDKILSNSTSEENNITQPLGTLAGQGVMTGKNKGGHMFITANEPSILMGIFSLTPRICYTQGNEWHTNLKSIDDLHKPDLDQIGFQDLSTDQMSWADTIFQDSDNFDMLSAGKQPAWINYMTSVDRAYGNFAITNDSRFMITDRRYEIGAFGIEDLTTYIDPSKFNYLFAQTSLDAQNFWVQIKVDNIMMRKMSKKIMPNVTN